MTDLGTGVRPGLKVVYQEIQKKKCKESKSCKNEAGPEKVKYKWMDFIIYNLFLVFGKT